MRLGGPLYRPHSDPESWIAAVKHCGYRAAFCPVGPDADDATVSAYEEEARKADVIIAEVGAWSNPISPDEEMRKAAIAHCKKALALADRIGARCCVNIAGTRAPGVWDGPHADNFTAATFDLIVQTVREIIDAVKPTRSYYTLETMPWIYPDSAECYLGLMDAIDRERFAVHFDPVNLVCSPQRYFANGELIRECLRKLGPYVRSCHAKDVAIETRMTVHLNEVRPGTGHLDYAALLIELNRLDVDIPLMLEHLFTEQDYQLAADHIRSVAKCEGVPL